MEATLTKGNEPLIEEMLQDAESVEVPSELKSNPIIHRGDETLEAPMTVKEMSSAGYKSVWDTRTYEWAPVLYYMLQEVLGRKRTDGSHIWTTVDPKRKPQRGTYKCMLHKDNPGRKEFDLMGLRVCPKDNIRNDFEVKQHMLKKHPKEWLTLEDVRKEKERQEDRDDAKLLRNALIAKTEPKEEKAPLYVSAKDKAKK